MRSRVFLALLALLLAFAAPARAEHDGETLDRILPDIRAAHPGRLSDAQPWVDDNGRMHYRIKWMTPEGRILFFDADARTGRFAPSLGDDGEHWRGGGRGEPTGREGGPPPEDRGRHHDNFSGGANAWPGVGDLQGRSGGDWHGHGGGDWRGGRGVGDNGGWHQGHGGH
jgi:hypothetical protein